MNNATRGRSALQEWESSKPDNFFSADRNLQRVLRHYLSDEAYSDFEKTLVDLGEKAATILDETAKLEDHIGNHPLLNR